MNMERKHSKEEEQSIEDTIAKNIRIADDKASYDAAYKRLLSEKIILA